MLNACRRAGDSASCCAMFKIPDQVRDDGACHAELDSASYCAMFKIPDQVRDDVFGVRDDDVTRLFPLEHRDAFEGGIYGYGLAAIVGFSVVDVLPISFWQIYLAAECLRCKDGGYKIV